MAASYMSPRYNNDLDYDDCVSSDYDDDRDIEANLSDEDTEDASETDMVKREEEYTEIKEQMYQDKLLQIKKQLQQLQEGVLPEYMKKNCRIEQQYRDRLLSNEIWRGYEQEVVEKEWIKEKQAAVKDFEEKKFGLKENLIAEFEEKKRHIENERSTMELTGDSMEVKPVMTRKLRRRPNDPMPLPEKRRKPSPAQLNYILDESEILEDLKALNKLSGRPLQKKPVSPPNSVDSSLPMEAKIEDGRLYYDKRWFHKGQPVYIEAKDMEKIMGIISTIGTQEILVKRCDNNSKLRIYLTQLQKGKYSMCRRSM
ncbi:sin3 histone deacetylase corepressor complex component SDS3 isoform X1 [Octopus sinensis]|uniref:Sin3 histone deacetylase corepressor complex component SDS3 isoform X1 n=2 Tax=Octopus sinensis TaxID=2607531 RepID=A0A6P7SN17_9MOLL|nr:sin3 histone deacetylase corepressor complex component SDS3 isoform X1 [Octopus sinensis]